jgi:hypothetical protein
MPLSVAAGRALLRREHAAEVARVRALGMARGVGRVLQRKSALVRAARRTAPQRTAPIPGAVAALVAPAASLIPGGSLVAGALGLAGGGPRPMPASVAPAGGGMVLVGRYGPYPVVILTGYGGTR